MHDTNKLLDQAMPSLEKNARKQLLLHRFLGGLPETVSRQPRATGEVKTLGTAIAQARLLMTIDEQSSGLSASAAVAKKSSEVDALKQKDRTLDRTSSRLVDLDATHDYRPTALPTETLFQLQPNRSSSTRMPIPHLLYFNHFLDFSVLTFACT